jgi:hypothetical protein
MTHDDPNVFKEMYKGRILEALRRGNAKRPWWAIVDGRQVSPSRGTTSTFTSPVLALKCAKDMVDEQIGYLSRGRLENPELAVRLARSFVEEAESMVRRARDPKIIEQGRVLLDRVKQDLVLAEAALAKAKSKGGQPHGTAQPKSIEGR